MKSNRPSGTALGVARVRAAHQLLDNPKVFDDPFALSIIGSVECERVRARLWAYRTSWGQLLRAYLAARSRYAEDKLRLAWERGVRQYVILGAGLDTFAYRNPCSGLRVFEVDHASTQAWKNHRLRDGRIAVPAELVLVPVDFERQTLPGALAEAGLRRDLPAFFSWLGVIPYLSEEAALETFRFIASSPAGSCVAFDYLHPVTNNDRWIRRVGFRAVRAWMEWFGEPLRLFYEPQELAAILDRVGLIQEEDLGSDEINARYFSGRIDGLRIQGGLGRFCCARV